MVIEVYKITRIFREPGAFQTIFMILLAQELIYSSSIQEIRERVVEEANCEEMG